MYENVKKELPTLEFIDYLNNYIFNIEEDPIVKEIKHLFVESTDTQTFLHIQLHNNENWVEKYGKIWKLIDESLVDGLKGHGICGMIVNLYGSLLGREL